MNIHIQSRHSLRVIASTAVAAMVLPLFANVAIAASSWNPTMLVNTESFNTIDEGDSTTNIEIRFGQSLNEKLFYDRTANRFTFTKGIYVNGSITGSGLTIRGQMSGSSLNVSRNATVGGTLTVTGAILTKGNLSGATIGGFGLPSGGCTGTANKLTWDSVTGKFICAADQNTASSYTAGQGLTLDGSSFKTNATLTGSLAKFQTLSGNTLRIGAGGADIQGNLAASGSVRTDGDLTLNDDQTAADAVLTFGQPTTNQTLKYLNAVGKFQFSRGLSVLGTLSGSSLNVDRNATVGGTFTATGAITTKGALSGSSLTVDGALKLRGITYTAPTSQTAGGVLKTDGAGNLSWAASLLGSGSGNSISLQPQYPNAAYFASGSTVVGQLTATGGTAGRENVYRWTSSKTAKNDYWIGVRVRVPDNFSSWINTAQKKPIELRYRTGSGQSVAQSQGSYVTVKMTDTAGAAVALTGGANLASTSYTTASVTGPEGAGTWTKGGYFNIWVKLAASTTPNGNWFAEAGYLNISWLTTAP